MLKRVVMLDNDMVLAGRVAEPDPDGTLEFRQPGLRMVRDERSR